ncbi:MAG TPA: hypothetical protein VIM69_01485 [Opitutaceae bacterium]
MGFAQEDLYRSPHHLDGIEGRGAGWQKALLRTGLPDQNHDVVEPEHRQENLSDIGLEDLDVGRPFDGHARGGATKRTEEIIVAVCQRPPRAW